MSNRCRLAVTAIVMAAASLTLAGCVNLPTSGNVGRIKSIPIADLPPGNQVGLVPRAPEPGWNGPQIVSGFLAATGAEAGGGGLNVARQYLAPGYARNWHPGSAPEVIDTGFTVTPVYPTGRVTNEQAFPEQVTVKSAHLEVMVGRRLQAWPKPGRPYVFTFTLGSYGGRWRIDGISGPGIYGKTAKTILLLDNSDFRRDYQPRNLYFPASNRANVLVPYPVYISDSAPLLGVRQLVKSLLTLPRSGSNWLYGSVTTAFPPRTKLGSVQVGANQAVIDLGGAAAHVSYQKLQQMRAQIFWTLTHSPYSGTGITSVSLQVGKRAPTLMRQPDFSNWVPQSPAATESLFYQTLNQAGSPVLRRTKAGSTFQSRNAGATGRNHNARFPYFPVQLPSTLGRGPFTTFAISPTASFAGCRGKTLYVVAPLLTGSPAVSQQLSAPCTSLTWGDHGHLFVAAGTLVQEGTVVPIPLGLQLLTVTNPAPQIPETDTYPSLSFAPDGVRVAMIVRGHGSGSLFVAAAHREGSQPYLSPASGQVLTVGPDVSNPVAVAWWDADHLLVLDRGHGGGPVLRVVPLDGGPSVTVPVPPGTDSVTSNGSIVAIGVTAAGGNGQPHILVSQGLGGLWEPVAQGSTPAYPG